MLRSDRGGEAVLGIPRRFGFGSVLTLATAMHSRDSHVDAGYGFIVRRIFGSSPVYNEAHERARNTEEERMIEDFRGVCC